MRSEPPNIEPREDEEDEANSESPIYKAGWPRAPDRVDSPHDEAQSILSIILRFDIRYSVVLWFTPHSSPLTPHLRWFAG